MGRPAARLSELSRSDLVQWPLSSVALSSNSVSDRSNSGHTVDMAATLMTRSGNRAGFAKIEKQ